MRFTLTLAYQILSVTLSWQLYSLTESPLSLGLLGLSEAIPAISLALVGGYISDRYNRARVGLLATPLIALSAFALAMASVGHIALAPWMLYTAMGVSGFARGFISPANQALLAQIAPRALLAKGAAWSSTVWQMATISGPAAAGLLYPVLGPVGLYTVVVSCATLAVVGYALVRVPKPQFKQGESILASLREGISFVRQSPLILSALSLDMFAVLFGGAVALLPAFAKDVLAVGAEGLGLLRAAPSVGAVLVTSTIALVKPSRNAGLLLLACVFGFGLANVFFALSTSFYLSLGLLLVGGMLDGVSVVIRSTILQLTTPDAMRGRVSAINTLFVGSSNEIGALESGLAAQAFGLVPSVVLGGLACCSIVLFAAWKWPVLLKLDMKKLV